MKKSQMIAAIADVLRDTYLLNDENIAETILGKIEQLGMKPPVEEVCPVLFTTKNVWEKEDA
jgi:hypothetical protein